MTHNDEQLFQELMRGVTPLKQDRIVESVGQLAEQDDKALYAYRRQAATSQQQKSLHGLSDIVREHLEPDAVLSWCKAGIQDGVFKQLRLGRYEPDATLDLHKMTIQQAMDEINGFVHQCQQRHVRCALIIHGKGKFSSHQPALLKSLCYQWLKELPQVLAFHSAHGRHGGTGATYIMLKKKNSIEGDTFFTPDLLID